LALPADKDSPCLKIIYDNIKLDTPRPKQETIIKLFIQCAQSLEVRVLFDALDGCNDRELGGIYRLVQEFHDAHIGVYITTRQNIVGLLKYRFPDAMYWEDIKADEGDIRSFLEWQIQGHSRVVEPDLRNKIISRIGGAQGMYQLRYHSRLTESDFSSHFSRLPMFLKQRAKAIWRNP